MDRVKFADDKMDPLTTAIVKTIEANGYQVDVWESPTSQTTICAVNKSNGGRFQASADDPWRAATEIAERIGIELTDD